MDYCYAYIDDILVASYTEEEHEKHLRELLARLQEYGVIISPVKCVIGVEKVPFLWYLVSGKGIEALSDRTKAIREFPRPTTIKQLRQFLGTLNFYLRFIQEAVKDQAKLNSLIGGLKEKGKETIEWVAEYSDAFVRCKESLPRAILLSHSDSEAKIALTTDASDTALDAVLQQRVQGEWQLLGFFSKKLNPAQKKYSPYDRELFAIYEAVKYYKHMLENRNFTVYTDHKPISFAFQKDLLRSSQQMRQLNYIG